MQLAAFYAVLCSQCFRILSCTQGIMTGVRLMLDRDKMKTCP